MHRCVGWLAVLGVVTSGPSVAQDCGALLRGGVFDISQYSSDQEQARSFASWYCDKRFSSEEDANSLGASGVIPVKGVPVRLGFDSKKQSFQSWQTEFCSKVNSSASEQSRVRQFLQTASSQIIEGFNRCISAYGIHAWLERTADPRTFVFAAKFVPANDQRTARISTKAAPFETKCDIDQSVVLTANAVYRAFCTRGMHSVSVIVNSPDYGVASGGMLSLPAPYVAAAAPAPPPPPPVPAFEWRQVGVGDCTANDANAGSSGNVPARSQCNEITVNKVAVCWDGATHRHPKAPFCTYKTLSANQCTGGGSPGVMYSCVQNR